MFVEILECRLDVCRSRPWVNGDPGYHYFQEHRSVLDSLLMGTPLDGNRRLHTTVPFSKLRLMVRMGMTLKKRQKGSCNKYYYRSQQRIPDLQDHARVLIMHACHKWPEVTSPHLWPYAIWVTNESRNYSPCFGVQEDFTGLKYEYESAQRRVWVSTEKVWVSTEKGMSQQRYYMPREEKKMGIAHSLKLSREQIIACLTSTQQQRLPFHPWQIIYDRDPRGSGRNFNIILKS